MIATRTVAALYNTTSPGLAVRGENLKNTCTETKKSGRRTIYANTMLFPSSSLAPGVGTPKGYSTRGGCGAAIGCRPMLGRLNAKAGWVSAYTLRTSRRVSALSLAVFGLLDA